MKRTLLLLLLTAAGLLAQTSADSVTITFRAHKGAGTPVALPGQFSGWSTGNTMTYDAAIGAWTKTYTFKIHDAGRGSLGDSVYQYKFHDGNWYADPLNPEQNAADNNNSVLRMTKLFFFEFYQEQTSTDITRLVTGIVHANSDVITSVKLYAGINASSAVMTDVTSSFLTAKRVLNHTLASPLPKTYFLRLVATNDKGDSIVYVKPAVTVISMPMPGYARHGVTKASIASGDSTTFRIRVPGKTFVMLRIAPAGQVAAAATPVMMRKDPGSDNWWLNLKLEPNTIYEYLYEFENNKLVSDPFGRQFGTSGTRFSTGSAGLSADDYTWQSTGYQRPPLNKLVIYELNVGEFGGGYYGRSAGQSGFSDLKSLLWHFKDLGVNAIELMPVNDYGTVGKSGHSWGYDLNHYFALEPGYGIPLELKQLIDEAHKLGIAVILDVVYNHQNDTGPLWQMLPDEAANPYFKLNNDVRYNEDGLQFFKDMDHWTAETQELILENLKMWIEEYRIDGFRYDYTQGIGWNTAEPTKGILGWANAVDTLYDGTIYQIAEHLPGSPALVYHSGLTGGWHDSFRDEIFDDARFQNTSLTDYENHVLGLSEYPGNDTPNSPSSYGGRTEPVNATITHDEQSLIYEMTQFQGIPLAEALQRDKLYATFVFTSLGIPMLWMGQEFSAPRGWSNDGLKLNYRPLEWDWSLVARGIDHMAYYRTLIKQRLKNPALYQGELKKLFRYEAAKTIVYGFEDAATNSKVMVVANLHPFNQSPANVPWLGDGTWYDVFDQSQLTVTGGSVPSFPINAFTAKVYSNKTNAQLGITSVGQGPDQSGVPTAFELQQNYPNPFNPSTQLRYAVPTEGLVSVKVYDMLGREAAVLVSSVQTPGLYSVTFDGAGHASGIYLCTLTAGGHTITRKMMLVK
ncbi:MAG: T9SS type A sorting domain-containing protein [Bacteroidetes bacterium]|nr:T9SS type A sorting domain-containing protein [Bacteroidota bacterium]